MSMKKQKWYRTKKERNDIWGQSMLVSGHTES